VKEEYHLNPLLGYTNNEKFPSLKSKSETEKANHDRSVAFDLAVVLTTDNWMAATSLLVSFDTLPRSRPLSGPSPPEVNLFLEVTHVLGAQLTVSKVDL